MAVAERRRQVARSPRSRTRRGAGRGAAGGRPGRRRRDRRPRRAAGAPAAARADGHRRWSIGGRRPGRDRRPFDRPDAVARLPAMTVSNPPAPRSSRSATRLARRRRLPDLPAQLRRPRRRRRRRPARDHRPPRPLRARRARRRRDLAVADLPVAGPRPRLRRQRPHRGRPAVRRRRPTSTGSSPRATRRGLQRDPRPGDEPHERRAPVVPRLEGVAARARTPTATCGATRPATTRTASRSRRTTGCRSSAARPGSGSRSAASSTSTRSSSSQPELNWRNPAVEAAQWDMVRGWLDARRRRLPARRLQRLPEGPGAAASNPVVAGDVAVGPARSISTTSTSRTSRS